MIVTQDDEKQKNLNSKDVTDLKFEPVLNVKEEVNDNTVANQVGKCSVDSDLGLLAVESSGKISCIDIKTKKEIFTGKRKASSSEMHSHSWIVIDEQKYLAVQWDKNTIRVFKIKQDDNSFTEAKELEICLDKNDKITCCEFDESTNNIFIVKNGNTLEKRVVKTGNVLVSIKLEQAIRPTFGTKILSLSNDGKWCVIGGGSVSYFVLIEIDNKAQHKVTSKNLKSTYCPCFVNGDSNFCVVGGSGGKFEVWDVKKRVSIKLLDLKVKDIINCLTSSNNILAVGTDDKKKRLTLWDIRTWEMFWSQEYDTEPTSVHLTNDSKYLTIGGYGGEKCLILAIK